MAKAFALTAYITHPPPQGCSNRHAKPGEKASGKWRSTHALEAAPTPPQRPFLEQNYRGATEFRNLRRLEFPTARSVHMESESDAVRFRKLRYLK